MQYTLRIQCQEKTNAKFYFKQQANKALNFLGKISLTFKNFLKFLARTTHFGILLNES